MATIRLRTKLIAGAVVLVLVVVGIIASQIPSWAADALLHPPRRRVDQRPPHAAQEVEFAGAGVSLKGGSTVPYGNQHHRATSGPARRLTALVILNVRPFSLAPAQSALDNDGCGTFGPCPRWMGRGGSIKRHNQRVRQTPAAPLTRNVRAWR